MNQKKGYIGTCFADEHKEALHSHLVDRMNPSTRNERWGGNMPTTLAVTPLKPATRRHTTVRAEQEGRKPRRTRSTRR